MDDNQRSAMFNAWKGSKKWIDVKMTNLENGKWEASCEVETLVRDTKAQAIYAISGNLSYKGYEISNLAEIQGL